MKWRGPFPSTKKKNELPKDSQITVPKDPVFRVLPH